MSNSNPNPNPNLITVGQPTVDQGSTDTRANFHLLDTGSAAPSAGQIVSWSLFAQTKLPITLVIYRRSGASYVVVGRSSTQTPDLGENTFELAEPITVAEGDLLGWHFSSTGTVPYIGGGDSVLFTEQNGAPTAFTGSGPRTYSIQAHLRPPPPNVAILGINAHGEVKRVQSDEYVEIENRGTVAVDLSGWRLLSAGMSLGRQQGFTFPAGATLEAGATLRVYTNAVHSETGGYSFASKTAIWRDGGDVGTLYDAGGDEVSRFAYGDRD